MQIQTFFPSRQRLRTLTLIGLTALYLPAQAQTHTAHAGHHATAHHADHITTARLPFQQAYWDDMQPMHDGMMNGITAQNPDIAFAKSMIPHHEGAIGMAKIQLTYGKDNILRTLAQTIITAQEPEIAQMQTWLKAHPDTATSDQTAHYRAYLAGMDTMHRDMTAGLDSDNPDIAFAQSMIAHHQGAIDMANIQLQYGQDSAMRQLAEAIISAQTAEIAMMNDWLKRQAKHAH